MDDEILTIPDDPQMAATVARLLKDLPAPIREYIGGPERDAEVVLLANKHGLHIDQAGELERAFLYMLLGVYSPEEFSDELIKAEISEDTVIAILKDINEDVFVPIREAEQVQKSADFRTANPAPIASYQAPEQRQAPAIMVPMPAIEAQPMEMSRTMQGDMAAYQQGNATHSYYAAPNAPHQPGWQPAASVHVFVPNGQQMGPIQAGMPPAGQGYPNMPAVPAYEAAFQPNVPPYQVPVATQPVPVSTAPRTPWTQPATPRVVPSANTVVPKGPPPPTHLPGTDPYREPVE